MYMYVHSMLHQIFQNNAYMHMLIIHTSWHYRVFRLLMIPVYCITLVHIDEIMSKHQNAQEINKSFI